MIEIMVGSGTADIPGGDVLTKACAILDDPLLGLGELRRAELRRDILSAALRLAAALETTGDETPDVTILGYRLVERQVRSGLETEYREMARLTKDRPQHIRLVDLANQVRPRTLL
jgi:serine/threonine-protein kinase PknG